MSQSVIQHPAMLPWALAYARRGWPVFPLHTPTASGACSCGRPCGNPGKHPRTRHGLKQATTDEETIRRWWSQWPDANIGLVTGTPSGILAVDVDPKNGGAGTWSQLALAHDLPTLTITADTGSGGWHLWYQRPTDRGVCRSRANAIKPGIDTRCDGGYVVAPPSLHVSGKRYAFRVGAGPDASDLQPCPPWLLDLLYPQPSGPTSAAQPKRPAGPTSTDDGWLLTAFRAAGLVRRDLGPDRAAVVCPWEREHSSPAGELDTSTVVFRPTTGRTLGWYHCSHAHCSGRTMADVRAALPNDARAAADAAYPPQRPGAAPATPDSVPGADADGVLPDCPDTDWQSLLSRRTSGELHPSIANAILILTHDDQWAGVLAHDAFSGRSIFRRPPPWYAEDAPALHHDTLDDQDSVRLVSWLDRRWSLRVARETADAALEVVCQRHAYHPVRDYLSSLVWDGVQRLPTFAATYLGAEPDAHYQTAPLRWFVCAVRRVFEPGCQADSILVLEGEQGIGKSKALRILASDNWFADEIGDPASKDAADALRGKWVIEIGELRWRKSDEDTRKAFISRRVDHYRPAYGRRTLDVPRQCVLAASTNEHDWQTDPTGARRYWAVRCSRIDHAALARDRDQLWAEAMVRYRGGEPSWLQDDEVPAQVEALARRREVDPWEDQIAAWCSSREAVTVASILGDCLGLDLGKRTQGDARRVTRILRALGWQVAGKVGHRGARAKAWTFGGRVPEEGWS